MTKQRLLSFGLFIALSLSTNVVSAARDFSANPNSGLVATAVGIVFWLWVLFVILRAILGNPVRGTGLVLGMISFFLIALALPFYIMAKLDLSALLTILVFIASMVLAFLWLNLMEKIFPEIGRRQE